DGAARVGVGGLEGGCGCGGTCAGEPSSGPHESMMLCNGMCRVIGGTSLHTFDASPDFDRVLANLPRFELALFERFNESCDAMLGRLGVPVRLDPDTNPRGVDHPTGNLRHAAY